ncbi:hypothetical protein OBBRIDRAFT_791116 [Obba rivulosa]|uniref:Nudix hydrolase domain-containing protein n=1 Tax=Obba rivulosa TaxID=1052685 RepID=A0A8E2B2N1_9APHY|nr:hypothetical protein OBBRIDRAFT_791116 [Obba rivulosa]
MSSPAIPDSFWFSSDFMLGSGMVIIQPSTGKVVVLYESVDNYWFLPKGRKDIGETLEQAALREAYEESGYRVEFLPLFMPTNAPPPPASPHALRDLPVMEPFYISTCTWRPRRHRTGPGAQGGEYLTFWYVGQIPEDAVHHSNTGMANEQNYQTRLVSIEDALKALDHRDYPFEHHLVSTAYDLWQQTQQILTETPT